MNYKIQQRKNTKFLCYICPNC